MGTTTVNISAAQVKDLREKTGAPMMDCKQALTEAKGDMEQAVVILRKKGVSVAAKKAARVTSEGSVASYIHAGGKIGVLVEVNCESDFVARTDDFKHLVTAVALQVAGSNPKYLSKEDMPKGSDEDPKLVCLLEQSYLKDESMTIGELVRDTIAKTGENMRIKRFARFELGR